MSAPRSNIIAFKCRMGTQLTRLDFDLALGSSRVKQLFYSEEGGMHFVCMRLDVAVPRTRIASMLRKIQMKPLTNLTPPVDNELWNSFIFMGNELHTGEGMEIINTLQTHMRDRHRRYYESLAGNTHHLTHMLRDPIRRRAGPDTRPSVETRSSPVYNPQTPSTDSEMSGDEAPPQGMNRNDSNETDAPPRMMNRNDSTETVLLSPTNSSSPVAVFQPAGMVNGQPNTVEQGMQLTETIATIVRNLYNIEPGFNLPSRLDAIERAINRLSDDSNNV